MTSTGHPRSNLKKCIGVVALLALSAAPLSGCGSDPDPYQARVITSVTSSDQSGSLTPLERGKIRREVERVAGEGLAAWLEADVAAMSLYFTEDYVAGFEEREAGYAAAGKKRMRVHSEVSSGMTELGTTGEQALVDYNFTDDSYFADLQGKQLTEPERKETVFQLTLEKTDEGWRIIRIIGREASLQ